MTPLSPTTTNKLFAYTTWPRFSAVFDVRAVQTGSVVADKSDSVVRIVPNSPTTTVRPLAYAAPSSRVPIPLFTLLQPTPSSERKSVPVSPPARYTLFVREMNESALVVPLVVVLQFVPSLYRKITPLFPAAR